MSQYALLTVSSPVRFSSLCLGAGAFLWLPIWMPHHCRHGLSQSGGFAGASVDVTDAHSEEEDEMRIVRKTHGSGKDGPEVVLVEIEEGGHTWQGQQRPMGFTGKSVKHASVIDVMWKIFQKQERK